MKKRFIFLLFIFLNFIFISKLFAFDAQMQIDKTNVGLGDSFNLRFEVKTSTGGNIAIKDIKNINNFNIVGKSQSSSSATQIVVEDGKTKSKSITTYDLDLVLQAKSKGKFELGPAIINQNGKDIKTNSVVINVSDLASMNTNSRNNKINSVNTNVDSTNTNGLDYIYFFLIILGVFGTLLYLNKKGLLFENNKMKDIENIVKDDDSKNNKVIIENDEIQEVDIEKLDNEIAYPEINDSDFNNKIDEIFRKKVKSKFGIGNIDGLTYEEILEKVGIKQDIKDIVDLLVKIKYSNVILDKNKLLELIKDI